MRSFRRVACCCFCDKNLFFFRRSACRKKNFAGQRKETLFGHKSVQNGANP